MLLQNLFCFTTKLFFRNNGLWVAICQNEGGVQAGFYIDRGDDDLSIINDKGQVSSVSQDILPPLVKRLFDLKIEVAPNQNHS